MVQHDGAVCLQRALTAMGDKWSAVIVYCMRTQPTIRYSELQRRTCGINPRTLSGKLDQLESYGIVERVSVAGSSKKQYALTDEGRGLVPVVLKLHAWRDAFHPPAAVQQKISK